MAELADAQDLGSCVPCGVEVRILLSAYRRAGGRPPAFLFVTKNQPRSYDKSSVPQAIIKRQT